MFGRFGISLLLLLSAVVCQAANLPEAADGSDGSASLVVPARAEPGPPRFARLRLAARALRALAHSF